MTTRPFPIEDLKLLVWEDEPEGYKYIDTEDTGKSRWSSHHTLIFEFEGELWASDYSRGLSETQDQVPYEYDDPVAYKVKRVETVTTVVSYEKI